MRNRDFLPIISAIARAPETRHVTPGQENYDAAKEHVGAAF